MLLHRTMNKTSKILSDLNQGQNDSSQSCMVKLLNLVKLFINLKPKVDHRP